ncbi:MAG: yusO [Schlesneria sp.]|nr:yusO [Schlesneria sp.]
MDQKNELPLVLRSAYHSLHRQSNLRFEEHGVTADQFVLLATLARGDALTQRELAGRMPSDPSTVRAMLALLRKRGLVSRDTHPTDGRAKTVSLTKAGRQKFQQVWESGQSIRDQMVCSLSTAEVTTLVTLLRRVAESLAESSPIKAAAATENAT